MIIKDLSMSELNMRKMIEVYRKAENRIKAELTRKRSLGLVDFADAAALKRVQAILEEMTGTIEEQAPIAIESFFTNTAEGMVSTKTRVVETLVSNYLGGVFEAAETSYISSAEFLRIGRLEADEIRQSSLELVARNMAEGKGWRAIQKEMAIDLNNKGITAFIDKAGHKWDLTGYCSMLTRTTSRQAQVAAALTEDDWDLWQITSIGSTCPICSAYEGRVYSKSGTNPDYPPLATAFGKINPLGGNDLSNTYLNLHPNCLHSLTRYTPMGKTDKEVEDMKKFSSFEERPANVDYRTQKQRDDYREKEKARAEFRNNYKQYKEYKAGLGDDFPKTYKTFEKHKKLDDDIYKEWKSRMREVRKEAKEVSEIIGGGL